LITARAVVPGLSIYITEVHEGALINFWTKS
jgi:hypothetical protein